MALTVMYMALGTYKTAMKKAMETPELKGILQELLTDEMHKEVEYMCKKSTGSVLKITKSDDLT